MASQTDILALPDYALTALSVLEGAGYEAWCVGGSIRDLLRGCPIADIDIASDALWQEAQAAFEQVGFRTHETGIKHGTITVIVDEHPVEVTTYRVEGVYSDARHPDSVKFVRDIEEDLDRRDFTVNAIAYHPTRGLLDPHGGKTDIEARILRAVGNPGQRFEEDALRILRACRFASQLGFSIEPATEKAMEEHAELLETVSRERILKELQGFVCGDHIHDALVVCTRTLSFLMPELAAMEGFDQRTPYHIYDVLEHTAYVMQNTPPYPLVRWAALFHDMGKPRTFFIDEAGVGHFYGHARISIELAEPLMERFGMSHQLIHDIVLLVRYHDDVIEPTPKAVKRMLRRLDGNIELFRTMCDLKRGDALAQAPHCHDRVALADELEETLNALLAADEAFSLKDLAVDGNDLIALGIQPGPRIGRLLERALDAVIDEKIDNSRDALLGYIQNQ